jgi:hypothetical protein
MPANDYMAKVNARGLVYPDKSMSHLVLSPWQLPWIRENVELTNSGYDFLTEADEQYKGKEFYAFGDFHDGIDGMPSDLTPGALFAKVRGNYINGNKKNPTAEIFEVTVSKILELWETQLGVEAIDELANHGLINEPKKWKKTLDQPMPQWLIWEMLLRILKKFTK